MGANSVKMKGPPRRSRSAKEGRNWKCKFCTRAYLGPSSLVYHYKQQHRGEPGMEQFAQTKYKSALD